jgi:hypothetical protein
MLMLKFEGGAAKKHEAPKDEEIELTEADLIDVDKIEDMTDEAELIEEKPEKKATKAKRMPPMTPEKRAAAERASAELKAHNEAIWKAAADRKAAHASAVAEARPKTKEEKRLRSELTDVEMALDVETDPEKLKALNQRAELLDKQLRESYDSRFKAEELRDKLGISEKGKAERKKRKAEILGDLPGFEHLKPSEPGEEVAESLNELKAIEKDRVKKELNAARNAEDMALRPELKPVSGETEAKGGDRAVKEEPKVMVSEEAYFEQDTNDWFVKGDKEAADAQADAERPAEVVPRSVEVRLDQIADIMASEEDFDYQAFSVNYRRQNTVDKMLEDDRNGKIKLGFFKKWGLKREAAKLAKELAPDLEKISAAESAEGAQKQFEKMTPEQQEEYRKARLESRKAARRAKNDQEGPKGSPLGMRG